ncbi:MAG: hypothetical protein ABR501_10725 [Pyrinomonadaceae bacterium]
MVLARKVELMCGLGTCFFAVVVVLVPFPGYRRPFHYLWIFSLWLAPSALVGVGVCADVLRNKTFGRILIFVGGVPLALYWLAFLAFLGELFYAADWKAFLILAPGALGVATMIASLTARAITSP